jgi:type VI secretion system protein ImpG
MFRTCYPVDLYPLSVEQARLELSSASAWLRQIAPGAAAVLTLELKTPAGLTIDMIGLGKLRFFLDGKPESTHLLYELLLSRTDQVRVGDGSNDPKRTCLLPGSNIAPVGFARDEGMLEYGDRSALSYRLLTEYFSFPEKFLFVDLLGLDEIAANLASDKLVIQCMIHRYPDTQSYQRLLRDVSAHHFKLGCTPIINLFTHSCGPVSISPRHASYPVRVDQGKPEAFEVIQIKRVIRAEKVSHDGRSVEVPPFNSLCHADNEALSRFYWHASREGSPRWGDKGTDVQLHLVNLDFEPVCPAAEVLNLELLCSNRDLPEQIPFDGSGGQDDDFKLSGHSVLQRVRLLRKPTPSLRPPQRRGLHWRLVSHLSLNHLSLVEGGEKTLQEMLALYDFGHSPVARKQIQGIVSIASKPTVARVSSSDFQGFVRGTEITLTLNEDHYAGGSVYLFASILERLFALYCTPTSFTRLNVRSVQQGDAIVAAWPARTGEAIMV